MRSITRETTVSVKPRKYPPTMPTIVPMTTAMNVATSATSSEARAP